MKKQGIIDKLKAFFERFSGLGNASFTAEGKKPVVYDISSIKLGMVAEPTAEYGTDKD